MGTNWKEMDTIDLNKDQQLKDIVSAVNTAFQTET